MVQSATKKGSIVFSLTGGMGSGKSTIASVFAKQGVAIVDADRIARDVVLPGTEGFKALVEHFGADILDDAKQINRKRLGSVVFNNPKELQALNSLLHPRIHREARRQFFEYQREGRPTICYDIPLLFETRQEGHYRPVVVVFAAEELRIKRIALRDGLSSVEIRQRLAAQMSLDEKVRRATYVVDNSGDRTAAEASALRVLGHVQQLHHLG